MFNSDEILRHVPHMRRYAALLCLGDRECGDQLVEATLTNVTNKAHAYTGGNHCRVFLFRAMQHAMRDDPFVVPEQHAATADIERPCRMMSCSAGRDHSTTEDALHWLGQMPVEQRSALLLVAIEGLSPKEVASVLGTTVGIIKALFADARECLEVGSPPPAVGGHQAMNRHSTAG